MSLGRWKRCVTSFDHRCAYCGETRQRLTRDHFVPIALGGADHFTNVVPSCYRCNQYKSDQDPRVWCTTAAYEAIGRYFAQLEAETGCVAEVMDGPLIESVGVDEYAPEDCRPKAGGEPTARRNWHSWFRAALTEKGIEQAQLAQQIGVSRRQMLRYWFGNARPSEGIRRLIGVALGAEG